MTMFVLSPSVATTIASASSIPASCSTSASIPCPTMKPPDQSVPRRLSASSFSSTTVTSHPSLASWRATLEPTRPEPITITFMPIRLAQRCLFLDHALGEGDDEHLAGRLAQDVLDRRREEPRLPPPARRRAEDDQVDASLPRMLDDCLADRASAHRRSVHLDAVVGPERLRLLERRGRALVLLAHRRVERELERHADDVQRLHVGAALLGQLDRGRDHLLADQPELHRNEDPRELRLRQLLFVGRDDVLEEPLAAPATDEPVDDEPRDEPRRAGVTGARVRGHRGDPDQPGA